MEVGEVPKGIRWLAEVGGPPKVRIGGVSGRGRGLTMNVTGLYFSSCGFDDDSESQRSLSSYLFFRYLRDGKNNALSIFMLSGSIVLPSISV